MIHYFESSVILRVLLGEPEPLQDWSTIERAVTSSLTRVECARVLDRERRRLRLTDEAAANRAQGLYSVLAGISEIELSPPVLSRAAQAFPLSLRTLGALHLASALAYREMQSEPVTMATHDRDLAVVCRALGIAIIGA